MFGLNTLFASPTPARRHAAEGAWGASDTTRVSGLAAGHFSDTPIATAMGWRPAGAIAEGDLVLTFDRGLQPVKKVTRGLHWSIAMECPEALWPLRVPAGALGNREQMLLLPEQSVLVESDTAELLFGDPFALIVAADLEGLRGIERVRPTPDMEVIYLHLEQDEVVFAGAGALVFCPGVEVTHVTGLLEDRPETYRTLPGDEAAMLIECLHDEDAVAGGQMPASDGMQSVYAAACA